MRRWLVRLALLLLSLVLSAAMLAGVFLARPELVLTDKAFAFALRHLGAAYAPRWSRLAFSASSAGGLRHRYVLAADDACADDPRGAFKACFKRLELAVVVRYSRRGPRLEVLENLAALGDHVEADLGVRGPGGAAPFALPFVRSLTVDLPALTLRAGDIAASGRLSAAVDPGRRRPVSVEADLRTRGRRGVGRLKAAFTADTDLFNGGLPSYLDARGLVESSKLGRARLAVKALRGGGRYDLSGGAEIYPSTGPVKSARLERCRGSASIQPEASSGDLVCRYEVLPSAPPAGEFRYLNRAAGELRLDAALRERRLSAALKGSLDPIGAWYELSGKGEARLEGRLGGPVSAMTLSHDVRATLRVKRFEDLVAFLRETRYAVPAPIHVLTGPLSLTAESRGSPRTERQSLSYVLTTDLAGARQRLKTRTAGSLSIAGVRGPGREFEHTAEVVLQEVALELPRLEVGPAPKIALDRRIQADAAEPAASSTAAATAPSAAARPPFSGSSRVAVRTGKPLLLFSNLAKEPVPASLDLVATYPPAAAGGVIAVNTFDVELFRRTATIDHLNVTLSTGSTVGALEGLVLYATPSASIRIAILGTTERPRIELTSVPPMKREDIIALLIFGKNPNELDPEQTASVSNTETALESRAFGLASLYLFGATPIEHVGYDSATKTTSVKLRLPGGAHLTLGSDFDQSRQLSVRKPLSPHWSLQSEITEQGQQSKAATTFLEWLNRY